jgi:acyl-CoA thioesterase FadM
VVGGGRVKIEHEYELVIAEDSARGQRGHRTPGETVTSAETTLVCVDREGRVRALPDWLTPTVD